MLRRFPFPRALLLALALLTATPGVLAASSPLSVVVSIKPVHALVAGVMGDVASPTLLLSGATSPHTQALRPSQARALESADLVVWVGETLETFLRKRLGPLRGTRQILTLSALPDMELLAMREGGVFEEHEAEAPGAGHGADPEHPAGGMDPHLWLDPDNALVIASAAAKRLGELDPANSARYAANASELARRIRDTDAAIAAELAPVRELPYLVFHDAYQYFERHFHLNAAGAITISPDRQPGAKRLKALRRHLATHGIRCVFSEPQFRPRLVRTVVAGTTVRSAMLDPLGADIDAGADAWFRIMADMADGLRGCLVD